MEYVEREEWTVEDWRKWREDKLQRTLYNARKYVPYYKKYWESDKKSNSYEILENWPILTKQKINESPDLFIDIRYKKNKLYHDHTSGTTGTPLDIYLDHDSVKEQYALFDARVRYKFDLTIDDTWAIIGSQRVTDINRNFPPFWVYNISLNQLYFSSLHIAKWTINDYIFALRKYQPKYLLGYTNAIYELGKGMSEKQVSFPMKAVITNAEPLYDYQRESIANVFQCPVVETYGQAELVCMANTFPNGKMYESPDMGIKEIINISNYEEGQFGKLIATGLLNKAMPFIRYNTNDLISINNKHEIGTLPEFGKILGRQDDIIKLKDGRKIVQIDGIFSSDLNILQGQIIQEDFSDFTIKVTPLKKWLDTHEKILRNNLSKRLGDVRINIQVCDVIKKTWAGKFRVIKSKI